MERNVGVSTVVFATIWAKRRPGENSEDEILRRLLGCGDEAKPIENAQESTTEGGVYDSRNNVPFSEGFEVLRKYKGREYSAVAQAGSWVRQDDGRRFPTLNQLNASITAGSENVWNGNWKYRRSDGAIRSIDELRP